MPSGKFLQVDQHINHQHKTNHLPSLLFGLTTYLSVLNLLYYRRNGVLPGPETNDQNFAAQSKDAFSSNPQNDFDDEENNAGAGGLGANRLHHQDDDGDEYTMLHQSELDDGGVAGHSGLYGANERLGGGYSGGGAHQDTSYGGGGSGAGLGAGGYVNMPTAGSDFGGDHTVAGGAGPYQDGRYSPYNGSQNSRYN